MPAFYIAAERGNRGWHGRFVWIYIQKFNLTAGSGNNTGVH